MYCAQVAAAMTYLSGRNFVHRDIAARNVLVFSADIVKVRAAICLTYQSVNIGSIRILIFCLTDCLRMQSSNCLTLTPQLSDFGMSRPADGVEVPANSIFQLAKHISVSVSAILSLATHLGVT